MILEQFKTLLFFLFMLAILFYIAHSLSLTPSEDDLVTNSQAGEVIALFETLQDVSFDAAYIATITQQERSLSPTIQVTSPLSRDIGRKHPFSGRIVPLDQVSSIESSFEIPTEEVEEEIPTSLIEEDTAPPVSETESSDASGPLETLPEPVQTISL